jgi:hypothetical protein
MYNPPAEGNFCDKHGNIIKPAITEDYKYKYGIRAQIGLGGTQLFHQQLHPEMDKKNLSFNLLDLTIPNSFILLSLFGAELTH